MQIVRAKKDSKKIELLGDKLVRSVFFVVKNTFISEQNEWTD